MYLLGLIVRDGLFSFVNLLTVLVDFAISLRFIKTVVHMLESMDLTEYSDVQ